MTDGPGGHVGLFDRSEFQTAAQGLDFVGNVLDSATEYSVIATDAHGVILLWNEGARRLYGYSSAEVLGRSKALLHTPEDVRAGLPDQMVAGALRHGNWTGSVQRVRKDGSRFTAGVVMTPRAGNNGTSAGFVLVSRDVTQQERLSSDLEHAQAYARSLIESAPDAMVIVDADGLIQLANAETENLFGYSREQLIGRRVEMLIPDRFQKHHPDRRRGFFGTPRVRAMGAGLDLWARRQDGTEFPVEISLSPLETADGTLATASIRDVTERKRAGQALLDANLQLEAASRAKDRFLASMSHELRTPLNAILGFTGTMLMGLPGELNDEQAKQMRIVQASGRHLLSLINDLLDLARIEAGKMDLSPETIDCGELLEEIVATLRPVADAQGIALELEVAGRPELISDRRSLRQILINLTNNAIKFTDEGSVRIVLDETRDEHAQITRFAVIDTGCGIRPGDQEKLFAAFERIGSPTAQPYEGTGLGLYISQMLAPLLGAGITFESEFGVGSTFTLEVRN